MKAIRIIQSLIVTKLEGKISILIIQNSKHGYHSLGGKPERGDNNMMDTLIREVKEEIGYQVKKDDVIIDLGSRITSYEGIKYEENFKIMYVPKHNITFADLVAENKNDTKIVTLHSLKELLSIINKEKCSLVLKELVNRFHIALSEKKRKIIVTGISGSGKSRFIETVNKGLQNYDGFIDLDNFGEWSGVPLESLWETDLNLVLSEVKLAGVSENLFRDYKFEVAYLITPTKASYLDNIAKRIYEERNESFEMIRFEIGKIVNYDMEVKILANNIKNKVNNVFNFETSDLASDYYCRNNSKRDQL